MKPIGPEVVVVASSAAAAAADMILSLYGCFGRRRRITSMLLLCLDIPTLCCLCVCGFTIENTDHGELKCSRGFSYYTET